MASTRWKGFEKAIAAAFNTLRTPFSGSNSGVTSSDSLHDRLYVECKFHKNQTILNLMRDTEKRAEEEHKVPIVALADPEEEGRYNKYVMFNIKDLFKIVREIDLHELDKRIPPNTTIHKLMETSSSENRSLYDIRDRLTIEVKRIMRDKIISNEGLEAVKSLGAILYFIDIIADYSKEE